MMKNGKKDMTKQVKLNVCECGKLHLTYGSFTLHFEREEFLAFTRMLNQLVIQLPQALNDPSIGLASNSDHIQYH